MIKIGRQDLYQGISNLSEAAKDFICDAVISLAKFDFKIQFLEWYKRTRLKDKDEHEEKVEELEEEIAK